MACKHKWQASVGSPYRQCTVCFVYRADIYLDQHTRCRPSHTNKKRLDDIVAKLQRDYHERVVQGFPSANRSNLTFHEAVNRQLKLYCIPNGQKDAVGFLWRLEGYFGKNTALAAVDAERIKAWRAAWLEAGKSLATIKRHYAPLQALMREMAADKKIAINPCLGLFRKQWKGLHRPRRRVFNAAEIQTIYAACPDTEMRRFALLARNTAFRENNITELAWTDVFFAERLVWARRVKNGVPYAVKLNGAAYTALRNAWEEQGRPSVGLVFSQGKSPEYWNNRFILLFQQLGWHKPELARQDRATLHTFRHTACTEMVRAGFNDRTIMKAMGWTSTTELKTYAHLQPDDTQAVFAAISCGEVTNETSDRA